MSQLYPPLGGDAAFGGGNEAVGVVEKVFAAWYRYKYGGDRATLQAESAVLRAPMQKLWERGTTLPSWMARAFCHDVTKLEPALWTFVTVEGVVPTNNAAERALWTVISGPTHRAVGMTGGGRAAFYIYPDDDLAVVILTNLAGSYPEELIDQVAACGSPESPRSAWNCRSAALRAHTLWPPT